MPATVFHKLSATTPDNTAYEIRPSHWNSDHSVSMSVAATEISALFSNANGVSWGLSGGSVITASVAPGGGGITNINVSAGTTSNNLSAITFGNANGVSFGLNSSTITATVDQRNLWQVEGNTLAGSQTSISYPAPSISGAGDISVGIQTANSRIVISRDSRNLWQLEGNTIAGSQTSLSYAVPSISGAGDISVGLQTLNSRLIISRDSRNLWQVEGNTLAGSQTSLSYAVPSISAVGNVSVGFQTLNSRLIISVPAGGGGLTNINVSAGTTSNNLSALTFSNANGLSFGLNGSVITASNAVSDKKVLQSILGNSFATLDNTLSQDTIRFSFTGPITGGFNGNSFQISVNASQSYNATGNTFASLGNNLNDSRIWFSLTGPLSGGFNGSTLLLSNDPIRANHITAGLLAGRDSTLSQSNTSYSYTGNISGGFSGFTHQVSVPTDASITINGNTTQSSTGTYAYRDLRISGAGIASVGVSNGTIIVSVPSGGGAGDGGNTIVAGTRTASSSAAVAFVDANGLSWGLNAVNGTQLTGSYSVPVVSNALQAVGTATGSGTNTSRFAADDHVHAGVFSVGVSTGGNTAGNTRVDVGQFVLAGGANITLSQATAAGGANTISIVGAAGGGGLTNINVSAGTTSNNLSAVTFNNANGVSFGLNASVVTASVATSLTAVNVSAGTTSNNLSALTFNNANGVSFGLNASVVTASVSQSNQQISAFAASNTTQSSSGTFNASSMVFAGAGIASVGVTNGSVVVSVPSGGGAGDGGVFAGVSNLGNTAGSTGTVSTGNFVLVGGANVSLSQSTGAAGSAATITIYAGGGGFAYGKEYSPEFAPTLFFAAPGQASFHIRPYPINGSLTADRAVFNVFHSNADASVATVSVSACMGLYTLNGSTLSLASSGSLSYTVNASSTVSSASYRGWRIATLPLGVTATPGMYYLGYAFRTSTSSQAASVSFGFANYQTGSNFSGMVGTTLAGTSVGAQLFGGIFSQTTTIAPNSIAASDMRQTIGGGVNSRLLLATLMNGTL